VKERAAFRAEERRFSVPTNQATAAGEDMSLTRIERLDEEIIALLALRREMAQELPAPTRARAVDPGFVETVREITERYRQELGGAGELVARAVLVLCHPGRQN